MYIIMNVTDLCGLTSPIACWKQRTAFFYVVRSKAVDIILSNSVKNAGYELMIHSGKFW